MALEQLGRNSQDLSGLRAELNSEHQSQFDTREAALQAQETELRGTHPNCMLIINIVYMVIKVQPDATVCRYLFTAKSLYMFWVSQHPSSGVLKTVTAASGTGHNIGTATSLQRDLIGSPDQATLEGSSCISIMTCTGSCSYSF